eukprot:scaffold58648_cov71-Phaeocystis_antarctica.AAC.3
MSSCHRRTRPAPSPLTRRPPSMASAFTLETWPRSVAASLSFRRSKRWRSHPAPPATSAWPHSASARTSPPPLNSAGSLKVPRCPPPARASHSRTERSDEAETTSAPRSSSATTAPLCPSSARTGASWLGVRDHSRTVPSCRGCGVRGRDLGQGRVKVELGFNWAAPTSPPLATSPSLSSTARERTGLLRGGGVGGFGGGRARALEAVAGRPVGRSPPLGSIGPPRAARRALRRRSSRARATAKGRASEHADAPGVFLGAGDLPPLRHIPHPQRAVDAAAQQQGPVHTTMPRAAAPCPRQPRHGAQVAVQLRRRSLLLRAAEAPNVDRAQRAGARERARRERHAVHRPRASRKRRGIPRAEGPLTPPAARVPQPGGAVPAAARNRTAAQRDAVHIRQRLVACQLTAAEAADDPRVHPELVEVDRLGAPARAAQRLASRLPQPPADRLDDPQGAEAARLQDQPELVVGEDQPEEVRACRLSFGPRDGPHWRSCAAIDGGTARSSRPKRRKRWGRHFPRRHDDARDT